MVDEPGDAVESLSNSSEFSVLGVGVDQEVLLASHVLPPKVGPFKHHELVVTGHEDHLGDLGHSVRVAERVHKVVGKLPFRGIPRMEQVLVHVVAEGKAESTHGPPLLVHAGIEVGHNRDNRHDTLDLWAVGFVADRSSDHPGGHSSLGSSVSNPSVDVRDLLFMHELLGCSHALHRSFDHIESRQVPEVVVGVSNVGAPSERDNLVLPPSLLLWVIGEDEVTVGDLKHSDLDGLGLLGDDIRHPEVPVPEIGVELVAGITVVALVGDPGASGLFFLDVGGNQNNNIVLPNRGILAVVSNNPHILGLVPGKGCNFEPNSLRAKQGSKIFFGLSVPLVNGLFKLEVVVQDGRRDCPESEKERYYLNFHVL